MLERWQFNILFLVGVGGAILLMIGPDIGLDVGKSPTAITGIGAILTYVLTQKQAIVKPPPGEDEEKRKKEEENGSG